MEVANREAVAGPPRREPVALRRVRGLGLSLPVVLLAAAATTSAVLVLVYMSHLSFFLDDWDLLLHRRGFSPDVFLNDHGGHLVFANVAIYKAIQATFGMDSQMPYAVVSTATSLAAVVLLFIYVRRRVGEWVALAASVSILFMGAAYDDLLLPFQMCFFGSVACGLGALLALERGDRRGDLIACGLLVLGLLFNEIALAFAAGIALAIVLDRDPGRRLYVPGACVLLYAVWYVGWGHTASDAVTAHALANSPSYVLDGLASNVASLFGLAAPSGLGTVSGLDWGRPLLVGLGAAAILRFRSHPAVSRWFWATSTILLLFWFLAATHASLTPSPNTSRYQWVGGIMMLLIAAELMRGWRPTRPAVLVLFAVAGAAALGGVSALHQGYQTLRPATSLQRANLAALEITSSRVPPDLVLTPENSNNLYFNEIVAGPYLSAERKFGSPAYSTTELSTAPEPAQVGADKVLAAALQLALRPVAQAPSPTGPAPRLLGPAGALVADGGGCIPVRPVRGAPPVVSLPPGGAALEAKGGTSANLYLRRYSSDSFPIFARTLRANAVLSIPTDRSSLPWQLQLGATGPVTVCGLRGS